MTVASVYNDVMDEVNQTESFDYGKFNRMSRRGELGLLKILTDDTLPKMPPMFSKQKSKDWVAHLLTQHKAGLDAEGRFTRPANYYYYDNMYSLSLDENCAKEGCDEEEKEVSKNVIRLVNGDRFSLLKTSYVRLEKPTVKRGIAKQVGDSFEVFPIMAGIVLEYIRIPVFAEIVGGIDEELNEPTILPASKDYEWGESCRETLVYLISDAFFNNVSDISGKQMNNSSNQILAATK